ncbi:hypothetical protein OCU04_012074 [Sclerotinia nivalis]|uniref:Uncharacterized protein n=1 Tax=Sclerotinia nivalis TaxID=352851 RepID=A0A9X0AE01_9HELO|nr:hypothetical protein OCU04_012074 [Sclerotinia nivalis]
MPVRGVQNLHLSAMDIHATPGDLQDPYTVKKVFAPFHDFQARKGNPVASRGSFLSFPPWISFECCSTRILVSNGRPILKCFNLQQTIQDFLSDLTPAHRDIQNQPMINI